MHSEIPNGAGKTFVPGTITALPERECYQEELQSTLLQTTLTLDPRSYGGPLVDIRGAVIGINRPQSFIGEALPELAPRGSEFALPINLAMTIYEPMVARESRKSPWLGFSVLPMTPELRGRVGDAAVIGIYIDAVFDPSPASRASIRVGDLLAAMDGRPISSVPRFQRQLYLTGIGNPVRLRLYRDGRFFERELVVEQRPQAARPR